MSSLREDRSVDRSVDPPAITDYELPDGSTCRVVRRGRDASLIERWVGDRLVWGQAFARREDHEGQVADVVNDMRADPTAFERWWFRDERDAQQPTGQAMQGPAGGTTLPSQGQTGS